MINRFSLSLLFVCLVAPAVLFGQNYPEPGSAGEPLVPCTGCPENNASGQANAGLPLYPYDVPLARFVGRYVDSSTTASVHNLGMRTVRAERVRVRPARDRVYIQLGSAVGAYTLSTLFNSRLAQPPGLVSQINTGRPYSRYGAPLEKVAKPDGYFYAESVYSGWSAPSIYDAQVVLWNFDTDDRGYLYPATIWGWGVQLDDGRTDGKHLPFVAQYADDMPMNVIALRHGDLYSVVLSDGFEKAWTYDVTSPSAAVAGSVRNGTAAAFARWSKYEPGSRVALLNADRSVRIYTNAALVAGQAPLFTLAPPTGSSFADLAFDDDGTLWVSGTTGIWKLTPSAAGYTSTQFAFAAPSFIGGSIHASAGYVAVIGRGTDAPNNVRASELRLFRVVNGSPEPVATDNFFRKHYQRAPAGYAQPNGYVGLDRVHLLAHGGLTYLFCSASGLGDVYELGAVLHPPQLKINAISPATGPPAGGTVVTIKGRNFAQGAAVTFGGTAAATTFVDSFTLTAVAPKGTDGASVAVSVTSGGQSATSPTSFEYALGVPANVVASATSTTVIQVTWSSVPSATQYEIALRNPDASLTVVGTSSTTTFIHGGRTPNTAYVYAVRTIDGDGNKSPASSPDIATTVQFTDTTIAPGMRIKAAHVLELRQAANAMRAVSGRPPATFTDTIAAGVAVKRTHIQELRDSITDARAFYGIGQPVLTDYYLGSAPVRAVHLQDLLNAVR
jgi:hypothetical protein